MPVKSETRTRRRGPRVPAAPTSRLVPIKQGAREEGIPYTSLRDIVFRGEIPVIKFGKAWYFDRADLAKFIESRKERLA